MVRRRSYIPTSKTKDPTKAKQLSTNDILSHNMGTSGGVTVSKLD